jgi:heat shock protein HspQ
MALLAAAPGGAYIGAMTGSNEITFGEDGRVAPPISHARFTIGEVVRHRMFDFRGVIFDIDPVFANSEEWYQAIPEDIRPRKDQPFYHLLAENAESSYIAYVSQQNLLPDDEDEPVDHPAIEGMFEPFSGGRYQLRPERRH